MTKILLRHFLQVLLIPGAGVTLAWYGYIVNIIMPSWSLLSWAMASVVFITIAEVVAHRILTVSSILAAALVGAVVIIGVPLYGIFEDIPMRPYSSLDHGGILLTLFVSAAFSAVFRLYRAGYTALDFMEATGNLPKGSLSKLIEKSQSEVR